ncbi:phospho-acceptor domain-containing protein [Pseudomonas sp. URMO17WK12:I1]|uniref:sensor histidine kinase n=1 Tax=unclassified Pseudomonas TaxID=196821 RepID=UPI00047FB39B|nr:MULTISPECIES: sensor histidine kinase [unclassified Pseudomonas]PZW71587.1 phospho-acceptor domain-containing protein [Pseudomonas sp. URMO17WK12:I1]
MAGHIAGWRKALARPLPRNLLVLFLPWSLLIIVLSLLLYDRMLSDRLEPLLEAQTDSLNEGVAVLERHLSSLRGDLQFLSQQPLLDQLVKQESADSLAALSELFAEFSDSRGTYQHLRWLDEQGMERVRIDSVAGEAQRVTEEDLQNDSAAYYFVETMHLYKGESYLSRFDVERRYRPDGSVESIEPILRAAVPVFSERGERRGVLILDYRAERLLQRLRETSVAYGGSLQLLDHEGYWMLGERPEHAWGFLLGKPELTLASQQPSSWRRLQEEQRGSFIDAAGFWAYSHFRPSDAGSATSNAADHWLLLSHLPALNLSELRWDVLWRVLLFFCVLQGVGLLISVRRAIDEAERLRAEHGLHVSSRALTASNEQLQRTVEQLQRTRRALLQAEKLSSLGTMVAGVAHELNTPIGAASVAASTLERASQEFQAAMREGLKRTTLERFVQRTDDGLSIILISLERMSQLTRAFKQLATDRASTERRRFDLRELVEEVVLLLQPKLRQSDHRIVVDVAPNLLLDSYPGPLGQIVQNLVDNALVHAFDPGVKGVVTVRAQVDDVQGQCVIEVIDDGRGMDEELQSKIFDPFFTTRRGQGGTGLGLHITHQLAVDVLGAELEVASQPGEGARFSIRFDLT